MALLNSRDVHFYSTVEMCIFTQQYRCAYLLNSRDVHLYSTVEMGIFTQQWRCASFILSKQIVEDKQEKERTIVERLKSLKKLNKLKIPNIFKSFKQLCSFMKYFVNFFIDRTNKMDRSRTMNERNEKIWTPPALLNRYGSILYHTFYF